MECDEYLTRFHGSLLSLSMKGLLYKPSRDSQIKGNTRELEIEELSNFIASLPDSAKKKIAYYMILNTELKVSENLKNDEFIGLFVNLTPAIPLQTFIQWIVTLNLVNEVCAGIENLPSVLGEELIEGFLESPVMNEDFYLMLWCSAFRKICKIEKKNSSEPLATLISYFAVISQKLQQHLDFRNVSGENLCKLEEFLKAVVDMVTYHKNPGQDDEMYKLSIELKAADNVKQPFENCIYLLFKNVSSILNTLSFDSSFGDWKAVKNLSYRLTEEVKFLKVPCEGLDVLSALAENESDAIIKSLILNAKQGQKCNSTIGDSLWQLTLEDLEELRKQAFEELETGNEEMKDLFLCAVSVPHNQNKWLEKVFEKYKPDVLTTLNTSKKLIEAFNRFSNLESVPLDVIIPLCMQSPVDTIKQLCHLAISSRAANLEVFHNLKPACRVQLTTHVTLLEHIIMSLMSEELTSAEENYFPHFVMQLKKGDLVGSEFLVNLIKGLKEFLEKDEMNKATLCLTVMDSILVKAEPSNEITLLVFMSQVLGYFSWDMASFSTTKANGRDLVCSIVGRLMARVDFNMDGEILNRAREEMVKCWEVNQASFCDLWFRCGKTWRGSGKFDSLILALVHSSSSAVRLRQFLQTFDAPREVRTSIVLSLTKVLPVLTFRYWDKALTELSVAWAEMNPTESSSAGYEAFRMFTSAWYLLTLQLNADKEVRSCYGHCVAGFGRLFSSARLEGEALVRTYETILFIVRSIEDEEMRKSCYVILLPVLKNRLKKEKTKAHSEKIQMILDGEFNN